MIFPWQTNEWQKLLKIKEENRLPHALLLVGPKGIGKSDFAISFIRKMLCQKNNTDCHPPCHSCTLLVGRIHPNLRWIAPEGASDTIKIEQIRQSIEFINQTSSQNGQRFLLIQHAHRMNINAANALLKMLEEPPPGAIFILISDQWGRLPVTVRSRCQRISFPLPDKKNSLTWLQKRLPEMKKSQLEHLLAIAHHAPLAVLQLVEEEVSVIRKDIFDHLYILKTNPHELLKKAKEWQDNNPVQLLNFLISWMIDLLYLQQEGRAYITNKDYEKELTEIAHQSSLANNVKLMNEYNQIRNQLLTGINLNKQLLLEDILIKWAS